MIIVDASEIREPFFEIGLFLFQKQIKKKTFNKV